MNSMVRLEGEFAQWAAVAHELKSPLVLIKHLSDTLIEKDVYLTTQQQIEYANRIKLTAERMLRFTQHMSLGFRLHSENQAVFAFATEPVNINEVCQSVAHDYTPLAYACGQELRVQSLRRNCVAIANRDILYDIIANLTDNALRHNAPKGIVHLQASRRGSKVRLQVADQGNEVTRQEYLRLQHTIGKQMQPLSGRSGTSGIGLYIVGQLAHAMGGVVGVGRGAIGGQAFFIDMARSSQLQLL